MKNETVVLLHGILRNKLDMLPLENFLSKRGYDCINILYPARKKSLEDLTIFVHEKIQEHISKQSNLTSGQAQETPRRETDARDEATHSEGERRRLNFVTHSMGGLITRYYIATHKPKNLGKVVMLSPPNTGSEFADALQNHKLLAKPFRAIFGPASDQLGTDHAHIGTDITYPLGIIAGSKSINPLSPWFLPKKIVGPHDGIVPVERTKIEGMADHITLPTNHSTMMFAPRVMDQVFTFLKDGTFSKES